MEQVADLSYALDTFYFLMAGALVMWMAAGFAMLEAGLVRAKNTAEILTKNIVLYAVACIMFMLIGYNLMYPGAPISPYIPNFDFLLGAEHDSAAFLAGGDDAPYYSARSDFFFQVVFVAAGMSIVSGAVAERMKLWAFLGFAVVFTAFIYPVQGFWKWGGGWLDAAGFQRFRRLWCCPHVWCKCSACRCVIARGSKGQIRAKWRSVTHTRCKHATCHTGNLHPVDGLVRLQRRFSAYRVQLC